jgi:uncharacterized protein YqgQ
MKEFFICVYIFRFRKYAFIFIIIHSQSIVRFDFESKKKFENISIILYRDRNMEKKKKNTSQKLFYVLKNER